MNWGRRIASERGAMRPVQYVLILIVALIIYWIVIYAPSLLHQMSMSSIADEEVAKMNVIMDDNQLRREIVDRARTEGMIVSPAQIEMERQREPVIMNRITIKWEEEVDPWITAPHKVSKKVTAKVGTGEAAAKR